MLLGIKHNVLYPVDICQVRGICEKKGKKIAGEPQTKYRNICVCNFDRFNLSVISAGFENLR